MFKLFLLAITCAILHPSGCAEMQEKRPAAKQSKGEYPEELVPKFYDDDMTTSPPRRRGHLRFATPPAPKEALQLDDLRPDQESPEPRPGTSSTLDVEEIEDEQVDIDAERAAAAAAAIEGPRPSERYKFVAYIQYEFQDNDDRNRPSSCYGTIIGRQTILTAASCVDMRDSAGFTVTILTDNINYTTPEHVFRVSSIEKHSHFRWGYFSADVALIFLTKRLPPEIIPADLPQSPLTGCPKLLAPAYGSYGLLRIRLMKVRNREYSYGAEHEVAFATERFEYHHDSMICANLAWDFDPCESSTLGPEGVGVGLLSKRFLLDSYVLHGIASGYNYQQKITAGLRGVMFTRVFSYIEWIKKKMYEVERPPSLLRRIRRLIACP